MGATVDTQALDLRAQGGLDGGKSRGGQGDDAFAAVLSDLGDAKATPQTEVAAPSTAPAAKINLTLATVAPPDPGLLNISTETFAVTPSTSMPATAAPLLPVDKSATPRLQIPLPDATAIPASQATAGISTSIGQAPSEEAASAASTTSLFQALIDGTGAKTSPKTKTGQRGDDTTPAAAPPADVQGALTLPALIAAAASAPAKPTSAVTQAASDVIVAPSLKGSPTVAPATTKSPAAASPVSATADDAAKSIDTAAPISDVKVETHIAIAASHAVAKDPAEPQASKTEVTDAGLPTGALSAMAPQTRSVVQAVETLIDQAPVAVTADPTSTATPAPPRTMTLQLTPPDLGTVQVRLHLTGQALDLQLAVSSKETLGALDRDRGHLETALASQNYDLRTLTIQSADGAGASMTGDQQPGARGSSDQGGANQGTSGSGNSAGSSSGGERRPANSREIASDEDVRAAAAPRAGALFV